MRDATPPRSSAQLRSAQAEVLVQNAAGRREPCPAVVARCRAACRAGAPSRAGFVSQGHKSKCYGA
eukprot:364585-Chlamydomonas_euryale.AAC.2